MFNDAHELKKWWRDCFFDAPIVKRDIGFQFVTKPFPEYNWSGFSQVKGVISQLLPANVIAES